MKYHSQYIKLFYRWLSEKLDFIFITFGFSANFISITRLPLILFSSLMLMSENYLLNFFSAFFLFLFSFFDALDGSIAHKTKKTNIGLWTDPLIDRFGFFILFLSVSYKFYVNYNNYILTVLPLINLIFYYKINSIFGDILYKPKFSEFKKFIEDKNKINIKFNVISDIKSNKLSFLGIMKFLYHQLNPQTHNIVMYIILGLIFNKLLFSLILINILLISQYLYEVYKKTYIASELDR